MSTAQQNPYIGPRTFQKNEGHLFFGREREARDLIALVASEQLVLFYAQSGAGKSSIVNTRLIPNLERKDYEVLPVGRVSGEVLAGNEVDNIFIYNLIRGLVQQNADLEALKKLSLAQFLAGLNTNAEGYFYDASPLEELTGSDEEEFSPVRRALIVDQFEELLSTHPEAWQKREDFFVQLAQAMQEDPYLWVVLVMREDYIAALDPYAHHLPGGLRVRYYMQRLGREAALSAVKSPVEDLRPYADGVAQKLVDDLCSIKVQKPDGTLDMQPGQYVEPVQLQVVCFGLWNNLSTEGKQITFKDLEDVGDVDESLGKHYEGRVSAVAKAKNVKERLIREWFEKKLITAGGIRNMVLQEPNKKSGGLDDDVIQALQSDLVRAEKRGGATWYELTHDRLVEPILERNKKWFNENLSPLQRQAALWKDQDQNESWLLRDQALAEIEAWSKEHQDELIDIEKEFLEACRKLQAQIEERHAAERHQLEMANKLAAEQTRSAKRARQFNILSAVLVVIAILATIYAFGKKNEADVSAKEAKNLQDIATTSELSTIALNRFDSQLDLALLLGVEAYSINNNPQTEKALLTLLQRSGRYQGTIKGEEDIRAIQYSPDGTMFASLDKNGIKFWDADSRQLLNDTPLNGHFSGVTALALSKDGKFMASGASDGTIVIWDADKRQMLGKQFKAHNGPIISLAFSMDGKTLASASANEFTLVLWDISDAANPQPIGEPLLKHTGPILSIAFNPDGKTFATGSYDLSIILWDLTTREPIGEPIREHRDWVNSIAYISDGTILASASDDYRVILWNVKDPADPKMISELPDESYSYIRALAISPDDQTLAFGNVIGSIILWDISDPENPESQSEALNTNGFGVVSLAFSVDSRTLASSSDDGAIVLWDVPSRERVSEPGQGNSNPVSDLIFKTNEKTLITGSSDSTISFWDVSDRKKPRKIGDPLQGHAGQPTGIEFSTDGSLLESFGEDGTILFDVKTRQQIGFGYILTSPDNNILAYQILDKTTGETTIHLRDAKSGETIGAPILGQNPIFSPDSKKLLFQTYDKDKRSQLYLWDLILNKELASPKFGDYLTFSTDSRILVYQTTNQDASKTFINLWDVTTGKNIGGAIEGSYLSFSPNGKTLLYQSYNSETGETLTNFWDMAKSAVIKTVPTSVNIVNQQGKGLAYYTTYDPDSGVPSLNLLEITTGVELIKPIENGNFLAISADGRILLYQSFDGSLIVLNIQTGELIGSPISASLNRIETFGQILVLETYSNNEPSIFLINTATGTLLYSEAVKGNYLSMVQDGRILIYQSSEDKLHLLSNQYGNIELDGTYLTTSPDDRILLYQTFENNSYSTKFWDLTTNQNLGEPIKGTYLTLSPDGETLVTRNENTTAIFWDITRTWPFGDPVAQETDIVSSAALSPDGKTLAFANANGINLQDTISGKTTSTLPNAHAGTVNGIDLSPDKYALTIGEDGRTIMWDLNTFQPLGDPITGTTSFFSPEGKFVAFFDEMENTIMVWDLISQRAIGEPLIGQYATFSPDEKFIAVGDRVKNTTTLWDLATQQIIGELLKGQPAAFSPDGKTLAVVDGSITTLWDLTTQEVIREPFAGQSVIFSPDGEMLAASVYDANYTATFTLFDLTARKTIGEPFQGNLLTIPEVNDAFIVVDFIKNTTTFWDSASKKPVLVIDGIDASFTYTKINILVVRDYINNKTTLWNPVTREQIGRTLAGIYYPSFSPDGTLISMADLDDNTTIIWDLKKQEQFGKVIAGYVSPTICADNKTLAWFDGFNTTVVIWDFEKDQSRGEIKLGEQSVYNGVGITFNPGCDILALGDISENTTTLWDLTKNKSIGEPMEGSTGIFSPDGSTVLIYDSYNTGSATNFWNVTDASQIETEVRGVPVIFGQENSNIVVIQYWDPNSGSVTNTIWSLNTHTQIGDELINTYYYYPTFTADGKLIVYGKNGVTFWDVDKNKMDDQALRGHSAPITNMLFSPDGGILASLASDGIVLTNLDKQTSTHLNSGDYPAQFNGMMAFSPDARSFTALSLDGTIFSWDIDSAPPALHDDPPVEAPYKDFVNNLSRLALSPDGKYLIYEYKTDLNVWNIDQKKFVGVPIEIEESSGGAITFSPDGKSMFYNNNGMVFQWDEWNNPDKVPNDGILFDNISFASLDIVMNPADPATPEHVTPRYLFSTSINQMITQMWDWTKNSKIGDPISGYLEIIGSNPQTQDLIYKDAYGRLIKWDLDPTTWKEILCDKAGRNFTREEWKQEIDELPYEAVCPSYPIEPASAPTSGPTP